MTLTPADPALVFPFIGGRPCLDFVATLGKRYTAPFERLTDPDALSRWIGEAGLRVDRAERAGGEGVRVTASELAAARELRESIHLALRAAMGGDGRDVALPDAEDLVRINEAATRPDLAPQLAFAGSGSGWTVRNHAGGASARHDVRAAMATVARDAVLLIGGPLVARVKECENPDCSLMFLDDSQARRRRWCSMERCGNLAKVAGYRARSRAGSRS
ncbi:CGNR zinc finger domain-containing protein [Streptomyces sp. NPDC059835]|uniref:CGNR zinc finger domain-containing protein n=1 Tax=Streptomyces sp. NPDC059835 TaxID=3346967 RepID=UPI00366524BD